MGVYSSSPNQHHNSGDDDDDDDDDCDDEPAYYPADRVQSCTLIDTHSANSDVDQHSPLPSRNQLSITSHAQQQAGALDISESSEPSQSHAVNAQESPLEADMRFIRQYNAQADHLVTVAVIQWFCLNITSSPQHTRHFTVLRDVLSPAQLDAPCTVS